MVRRRRDGIDSSRITLAPGMLAVPNVRLVRKIAEGGMGSVWEAEHLGLRTNVAVKFVLDELGDNAEAGARFDREATAAARIKSPHVVQTLDHGVTEEGVAYIVMELLEGEDLEARVLRDTRLPLELVAHIVNQASKALEKAHGLGIVHRDIKPSNVYLTDVGGEVFVKILDFGIAKLQLANAQQMRVTQTGSMIGTPVFMAPEQMTQAKDVGPAADMWSLGVVAYVALTGRLPYDSDTIAGLAMAIERGSFPAATSIVPDLPASIDAWFLRALAKDPKDRFNTIREMSDGIAKVAGTHVPISSALVATKVASTPPPPPPPGAPAVTDAASAAAALASAPTAAAPPARREPTPPSPEPATKEDRPIEPAPAAKEIASAATLPASSSLGSATIMGASSERARQEAKSSTRTLMAAGAVIGALGAAAVLYGVLRGADDKPASSQEAAPPSALVTASSDPPKSARATAHAAPPPSAVATAVAASASSAAVSSAAVSAEPSASEVASSAPSGPPKLTGTLPSGAWRSPSASPSAKPSAAPATSATPTVTPATPPSAKPPASASPSAAPPGSAKPAPTPKPPASSKAP